MRHHTPWLYGYADAPSAGPGLHRQERAAIHAVAAADPAGRNRGRDLLHDFQLGGERTTVGRRGLASAGVKKSKKEERGREGGRRGRRRETADEERAIRNG